VATADVPQAWTEEDNGAHTQFLMPDDLPASVDAANVSRLVPGPHIIILTASGGPEGVELTPSGGEGQDVWELGRADSCDLSFEDDRMSQRHAQLVHQGGRWRLVNLVSTNGVIVNGEKRLSAYLNDGDVIQLGKTKLVFFGVEGAAKAASNAGQPTSPAAGDGSGKSWLVPAVVVAVLLALLAAAFMMDLI
jgi:hypothetical protein